MSALTLQQQVEACFVAQQLPLTLAEKVRTVLRNACAPGKHYDAGGKHWQEGAAAYEFAATRILQSGYPAIADAIVREWWLEMSARQSLTPQWFPYAIPAYLFSQIFYAAGDHGLAFRWALLSYAHDVLSNQSSGIAPHILQANFGLDSKDIQVFTQIGQSCLAEVKKQPEDWSRLGGFPEEVVRRFTREKGQAAYAAQIAQLASKTDFPVSPGYLHSLLHQLNLKTGSSDDKAARLEQIAYYLMSLLPGCVPKHGVLDIEQAHESDLVVRNLYISSNVVSDLFGRHILVECKNYKDPVGVAHVGYFLFRMRLVHAKFGVIFAPKGITGRGGERRAARALIRRTFHEDGIVCVVIDRKDIEALATGNVSLYWLLLDKYEEFRFGRSK